MATPTYYSKAIIKIKDKEYEIQDKDFKLIRNLGRHAYGSVDEMKHIPTDVISTVKKITVTVSQEQKRFIMDLDSSLRSGHCPYTVQFHGAFFREGEVCICREIMDASLDKFHKQIYERKGRIPEDVLKVIAFSVVKALDYLNKELGVIHRDVKPSNILINKKGQVKICDSGISGYLVDSVFKTMNAGFKPYMAPERINPGEGERRYDIKSDVWSIGITMIEMAVGKFPYPLGKTPFEQLQQVLTDSPPKLPTGDQLPEGFSEFSNSYHDFINKCLLKDQKFRANYEDLLKSPFIQMSVTPESPNLAGYVEEVFERYGDPNEN